MKKIVILLLLLYSVVLAAQGQRAFSAGTIMANPGEKVSGKLVIEKGTDDGTFVPFSIINGTQPGPVLTLNAGLHGTEYVPVIVLQKLLKEIEPDRLSGTLVLVHIANIPGFKGMVPYQNPVDRKNPNRVYPGKKDGTLSDRVAYAITNEIIAKSDYYLDLHGGEFTEQIVDYVYFWPDCPDKELSEKSRMLAHATGNHYIIPDKYLEEEETPEGTYSDLAAIRLGIPAISLEWGDRGRVDAEVVDFALTGMRNVLRTLGMIDGKPFINEHPVYLTDSYDIVCNFDGIFYSEVKKGQYVSSGSRLGYTTDYWGKVLEEYNAPVTGVVVSTIDVPAVYEGRKVFQFSRVSDKLE